SNGVARLEFFRADKTAARCLQFPLVVRPIPHAARKRIEPPEVEVPPILVGLAAGEEGSLDDERSVIDRGREDAERDVRGVEGMVAEWRGRIVHRRGSMHERDGAERR